MLKPIVKIQDAYLQAGRLWGIVQDYPDEHMIYPQCVTNGRLITTSPVEKYFEDRVEIQRTIYEIVNWYKKPDFTKGFLVDSNAS